MAEKEEEDQRIAAKKRTRANRVLENGANALTELANSMMQSSSEKSCMKQNQPEPQNTTEDPPSGSLIIEISSSKTTEKSSNIGIHKNVTANLYEVEQAKHMMEPPAKKTCKEDVTRKEPESQNTKKDPPSVQPKAKRMRFDDEASCHRIAHIPKTHANESPKFPLTPATSPQTTKKSPRIHENATAELHKFDLNTLLTPTSNSPCEEITASSYDRLISTIIGWDPSDLMKKVFRFRFAGTAMYNSGDRDGYKKYITFSIPFLILISKNFFSTHFLHNS